MEVRFVGSGDAVGSGGGTRPAPARGTDVFACEAYTFERTVPHHRASATLREHLAELETSQRWPLLGDEGPKRVRARLVQPGRGAVAEPLLERGPRGAEDTVNAARWLDSVGTAAHQDGLGELLVAQLNRARLLGQPPGEFVLAPAEMIH